MANDTSAIDECLDWKCASKVLLCNVLCDPLAIVLIVNRIGN